MKIICFLIFTLILLTGCTYFIKMINSAPRVIKSADYGFSKDVFLTIIVPSNNKASKPINPEYIDHFSVAYIDNINDLSAPIIFQGNSETTDSAGYYIHGKEFFFGADTLNYESFMDKGLDAVDKLYLEFKLNNEVDKNSIKFTIRYLDSELSVSPFSDTNVFNTTPKHILNEITSSVRYVADMEFQSKYNPDSVYANFQRLLTIEKGGFIHPITGNRIHSYFKYNKNSLDADIYLEVFSYRNGSKAVITAVIYGIENNRVIDFNSLYSIAYKGLEKIIND